MRLIITTAIALFAAHAFAANGSMKGDGSASKPFQIEDYEDLKAIGKGAYLYSSNYVLTKNIDASASKNEMCNEDGCNGFISIGKNKDAADSIIFWGSIDGQNHSISNLNIWLPCENDVAFISYLGGSVTNLNFDHLSVTGRVSESNYVASVAAKLMGSIKNVHVTNGFVQGQNYVGGIVGHATDQYVKEAVFEDVSFQGEVKGSQRVGGIAGQLDMNLERASVDAHVVAMKRDVGGIVGYLTGEVNNSRSMGLIVPSGYPINVGGIAGYSKGSIHKCVSTMDLVRYGYAFDEDIGGIVGDNDKGMVTRSYAIGKVEGERSVGGIVGSGGIVQSSFAMGEVRGKYQIGGVAGAYASIFNSYAANKVLGDSLVGGLVGYSPDTVFSSYWNTEISGLDTSAGGTGLSTAKMMKMASFAGWDTLGYDEYIVDGTDTCIYYKDVGACYSPTGKFIHYWTIDEGKSFPYLVENPFSIKSIVPIAVPTSAAKWQEQPPVASLTKVDGELVGKWLDWVNFGDNVDTVGNDVMVRRDSLYYGYRIGVVNEGDTVWGTSSYVAIPNRIEISTYGQLQRIGRDIAYPLIADYELTADIDASSSKFKPIGDSVHVFYGRFDGKNHTIRNLTIDEPNRDFTGMFGYAESATIENLTLENAKVVGSWVVGALIGEARVTEVRHVVSLNGDVVGVHSVGGLVGSFIAGSMEFVGTTGKVKGTENVGGVIGDMDGWVSVTDAFSVNVIKGLEDVGGVIGHNYNYTFSEVDPVVYRVYSASMLKAPEYEADGILGGGTSRTVDDSTCFFDSTVARIDDGGKTTAEMLKQSTYYGYDFGTVWEIQEGVSYPYFKGMDPILPGTLEDDGTVNVLAGAGTEINPYKIYDYDDLKYVGKYEYSLDAYYKLMGNIDATRSFKENCNADSTVCKGFEPIGEFSGMFIGDNKIIAGLNINRPDEDSVGLFRALASGAKVTGIVFDTTSYFGENYSYESSRDKGVIRGKNYVGTLAGVDNGATVENIFIKYDVSGDNYVGSLVGKKTSGSIAKSASRFLVTGKENVGGLVGHLGVASIADCYSIANVAGTKNVGGLVGYSDNATVKNSFAAGQVGGDSKWGGLVGADNKSTYSSAYYDTTLWYVNVTAAGELRNTQQMVTKENYKDWDFENTWKIVADSTYPYLSWLTSAYYISKTMKEKVYPNLDVDQTMLKMAGSGTEQDPFLIKTYGDLKSIGFGKYKLSSIYRLANDIDATASRTDNRFAVGGTGFKPIGKYDVLDEFCSCYGVVLGGYAKQDTGAFTGKFHGGGHSIDSLFTGFWDKNYKTIGFIDTIAQSAIVDSLSFKGYSVGRNHELKIGGIATVNKGMIRNVNVEIMMDSVYQSAGFVFRNYGTIENVSVKGKINNSSVVSGIALLNYGNITDAKVDMQWIGGRDASGVAVLNRGAIKKATVAATLKGSSGYMGGIAGLNAIDGTISESNAIVDVSGQKSSSGDLYISYDDGGEFGGDFSRSCLIEGVAGLVAIDSGTITNSTAAGVIDADGVSFVGGLIGKAYGKEMKGLHASVKVVGSYYVGGFAGLNQTTISESYATGSAKGTGIYSYSGAFVGKNEGLIERSFAMGNAYNASSFVGENDGTIRQSYSTGNVEGTGGFVSNNQAVIEDCYSTGDMSAVEEFYGFGFVGVNGNDAKVRGYASGTAVKDGKRFCVGLPARSLPSEEFYYLADACSDSLTTGKALSPSEMRKQKSFAKFNFDSIWYIKEGVTYPLLRGLPNVPFAKNADLKIEDKLLVKNVRKNLLDMAFVMDSSYAKVIVFDSTAEKLLDSLEKAGDKAVGEFEIAYRVGMLFENDTIWGNPVLAKIILDIKIGIHIGETTIVHSNALDAKFHGAHVSLRFKIPSAGSVKFSLFDTQGRVVRKFDLGHRAAGAYSETLGAENIARGRYIGILQVGGKSVEKTVLLKK